MNAGQLHLRTQVERCATAGMRGRQIAVGHDARAGLTLLELILSLALTVVLLALIGMAVDVNLRMLDSRQAEVEQAQLARAVVTRIAQDLRSAIPPTSSASDMIGAAEDLTGDAASAAGDSGAAPDDLAQAAGDAGIDVADLSTAACQIADSTALPATPGLYGNQYELQVDISRLPRVDEYQPLASQDMTSSIRDIASDVKTVAYYVRPPGATTVPGAQVGTLNSNEGGLVRRVLDRQVTLFASENGDISSLDQYGDVIAPEVTAIEFAYFDGLEWTTEWDSEEMGGLPLAVRITVSFAGSAEQQAAGVGAFLPTTASGSPAAQTDSQKVVSLVVRIPVAKPNDDDETDTVSAAGLDAVGL